jgi:hypothetical protein
VPHTKQCSSELIAKLIRAGYLRSERQHDPDAVTSAIARIKEDLRSGSGDHLQGNGVTKPSASQPHRQAARPMQLEFPEVPRNQFHRHSRLSAQGR